MNFKKTVAIATAVGALAAVSVPAMALENQFNGMYRLRAMVSNFENANATFGGVLAKNPPEMTVFEQRARLQYTAKASDDLKLVTQFEIDSSWGDGAYMGSTTYGRGSGGALGADTVNLETKHVYLDFNCPLTGANAKVGIHAQSDAYKGVLFNDDLGGVFLTKKLGAVNAKAGFARLLDRAGTGKTTQDLFLLDAKGDLSKDLTLGGSYYLVTDDTDVNSKRLMHMLGVNAAAKFGMVSGDAFLAYQTGDRIDSTKANLSAYAAQVAAKVNLDKAGTIRVNALYLSGDDGQGDSSAWQVLKSNNAGQTALATPSNNYYDSKLMLLARNVGNMDSDKALIVHTTNLTLLTVGYDAKINDKTSASVNLGYGMFNEKNTAASTSASVTNPATSTSIGTEINAQIDYKMFANLTTSVQAAYVILGDAVKTAPATTDTAANPYLVAVLMNYAF